MSSIKKILKNCKVYNKNNKKDQNIFQDINIFMMSCANKN